MAHTIGTIGARASSTGNPITVSQTILPGETVLCVMLHVVGGTNRAGGALTIGSETLTQADSTRKAVTSPEGSTELWYCLNCFPGTWTLTIPNTGALTIRYQVALARAIGGGRSFFREANGGNGTSTNPTPGALANARAGDVVFATVFSGATTWAPSAQAGTVIQNTDDGAFGGGTQYSLRGADGSFTASWTFGTSDDWGAVAACFGEYDPVRLTNYHAVMVGDGMSTAADHRFKR